MPSSSNAACSVTAGLPNGQRTATRRNARGGRPSCRSTIPSVVRDVEAEASGALRQAGMPLDDEELLARLDEAEAPRLAHELPRRCPPARSAALSCALLLPAAARTSALRAFSSRFVCRYDCVGFQ